jgi:hypothetical protein
MDRRPRSEEVPPDGQPAEPADVCTGRSEWVGNSHPPRNGY